MVDSYHRWFGSSRRSYRYYTCFLVLVNTASGGVCDEVHCYSSGPSSGYLMLLVAPRDNVLYCCSVGSYGCE
ncbi:hypothetical protein HOY82DRAFT_553485 [Tuber indicum]|nr:hypothetical protein HOY82DRAFT_553485 [Tuber indicum]